MEKAIFSSFREVIKDLQEGKPIILVDDEHRENEGDIVFAAQFATYDLVKLLVNEARGLICVPMRAERSHQLGLFQMAHENTDIHQTAFTVSVDAHNTTTGISVQDRLNTILVLSNPGAKKTDFRQPGHVFPLTAKEGGLFARHGHTEGSLDLLKMAGLYEVAVICEILNEDGTMARLNRDLMSFAKKHQFKITSVQEILKVKSEQESCWSIQASAKLPTEYGEFDLLVFQHCWNKKECPVLVMNHLTDYQEGILVRIHSSCMTGDIFHSVKCDCGEQLKATMELIAQKKAGVILYLNQEGRGIGLLNKVKAYTLQDQGYDTVEANEALNLPVDSRTYQDAIEMLKILGIQKIKLITGNPSKINAIKESSIELEQVVPLSIPYRSERKRYLAVKQEKMGHR